MYTMYSIRVGIMGGIWEIIGGLWGNIGDWCCLMLFGVVWSNLMLFGII
jgi:hypothetical protein